MATHLILGLFGLALICLGLAASHDWFDRHFLPSFGQSREFQWALVQTFRLLLGAAGLLVLLPLRAWAVAAVRRGEGRRALTSAFSILIAVAAAFGVTEAVLHTRTWRATQENSPRKEPERRHDRLLGWDLAPSRSRQVEVDGRTVDYTTDVYGNRSALVGTRPDLTRPSILFVGESVMFGYGLDWHDTIPARVEAALGVQAVNLAVPAYGTDQSFLRMNREIWRYQSAAVLILFTPFLLDRNLDRDRPHLDSSLRWHAAEPPSFRLVELSRRLVRYRSEERIADGVAMTQNVLRAAIAHVRLRGAEPLIVVPQLQPEDPAERAVRERVLDRGHIPYLLVPLDPSWRLAIDRHPDARGDAAIAAAIAARLRPVLAARPAR